MKKTEEKIAGITVIRSRRKTLSLEVTKDAKALIRAPIRMRDTDIHAFVNKHEKWLSEHIKRRKERNALESSYPETREELFEKARRIIPLKVSHYAGIMGIYPTGVRITGASTRFGSCSAKNSLCFSYRLMMYPEKAVDYVVIHELSHIIHHNHGKDFW
ncbi:MAG: M48 family metallopeptidase, partial [Eubacteriales bacterium]